MGIKRNKCSKILFRKNNQNYQNNYTYENDKLKTITHNSFLYNFVYDSFGNTKQVKVGNQTLITNNYAERNGNLNNVVYGNDQQISYTYDWFNRIKNKTGIDGLHEYTYDAKSNLATSKDNVNGNTSTYTYDLADRLVKTTRTNGFNSQYGYDENSNVNNIKYTFNNVIKETKLNFDKDNRILDVEEVGKHKISNTYDSLSRITNKKLEANAHIYNTQYKYKDMGNDKTTTVLQSIKNGNDEEISYIYDKLGNIETIKKGTEQTQKYYYDELNQLIREDNKELNKTIIYTYDLGGNIINKIEYPYTIDALETATNTINYEYTNNNWKDQLTKYDGKEIIYDNIGNPTSYDGNTYTWQNGRQLATLVNTTKGLNISYKYNDGGIRTQKTINGTTTKYYLERY